MQRHTAGRAVLNGAGVAPPAPPAVRLGHQRRPAESCAHPCAAPARTAPYRPAPGSAIPWSRRRETRAGQRTAQAQPTFPRSTASSMAWALTACGQLIDLAAGPLQLPVALLGRPAPPSGQRGQRTRPSPRGESPMTVEHVSGDLPLAGLRRLGSSIPRGHLQENLPLRLRRQHTRPPTSSVLAHCRNSSQIAPRACQSWFISEHHLRVELRRR